MIPKQAEIVIVGGGVVGASLAYFLAREGRDVALIDKGDMGGEASSANGAWAWTATRRPGIDIRLARHSIEWIQTLGRELERDIEYRRDGGLLVITDENQVAPVQDHVRQRAKDGYPLEMLDAKQARELEPLLSESILGAAYSATSGWLNPIALVVGLAQGAKNLGAKICYHTKLLDIGIKSGRVTSAKTDKGEIHTSVLVNAAGSWAGQVGQLAGLSVPVSPYQMQMVVTEQLPPVLSHCIMGASYMVGEYEKEDMTCPREEQPGCGAIASQQASGNLLLGATWKKAGFDKSTHWRDMTAIFTEMVRTFPSLKHVRVIRSFANFFPFTSDDLPILGPVDGLEGFIMAAGHNGHGICMGPGSAKLVQELICSGKPGISLDPLRLSRFDHPSC